MKKPTRFGPVGFLGDGKRVRRRGLRRYRVPIFGALPRLGLLASLPRLTLFAGPSLVAGPGLIAAS